MYEDIRRKEAPRDGRGGGSTSANRVQKRRQTNFKRTQSTQLSGDISCSGTFHVQEQRVPHKLTDPNDTATQ